MTQASDTLSDALALLAAVTARPVGSAHGRAIDWHAFVELVERHRVAPLAFDGLGLAGVEVPADTLAELRALAFRDRAGALRFVALLDRVQRILKAADVEVATIKGPTLAKLAFGDVTLRQSRDLDMLIAVEDVATAIAALRGEGFELVHPASLPTGRHLAVWKTVSKDVSLVDRASGLLVEVHWRLTANPRLLPPVKAASRRRMDLGGIAADTLGDDKLLLYLCIHGAQHSWFRLKWLADVHALLARGGPQAIDRFYARAVSQGLAVPAGQMLLLLHAVYGVVLPDAVAQRARASRRVRWLTAIALDMLRMTEEPEGDRVASTRMAIAPLLLRREARYVVSQAAALLIDWPIALALGGSRAALAVSIAMRPFAWIVRKARLGARRP